MSRAYLSYLETLFDSKEHSDCTINFIFENEGPPASKRPRTRQSCAQSLSDPARNEVGALPAHLMVLHGGSQLLSNAAKDWAREHGPDTRPELRVAVSRKAELPVARAAIRFMYTGIVEYNSAKELLQLRRMARYLQVEGCAEACDEVLLARVSYAFPSRIMDFYNSRHLLPNPAEDPGGAALLHACRRQLMKPGASPMSPVFFPNPGEVLAWAFQDAPSLLCDPDAKQQMRSLTAANMEALLGSDSFATDDEASVLLMLACWLEANPTTTSETREKLCRLIRLCHLNTAYLHGLLPRISWFPISREEHQFLCQYSATADARRRKSLAVAAAGKHDCTTQWYAAPRRPKARADAGTPYEWFINQDDLAACLDMAPGKASSGLNGAFANGSCRLVAQGFEWHPGTLWLNNGMLEAVLSCTVPGPFANFASAKDVVGVINTAAKLVAYRWTADGGREEASCRKYGNDDAVSVTSGLGKGAWHVTLFGSGLVKGPGAAAEQLLTLAPYLNGGKLSGSLTFL